MDKRGIIAIFAMLMALCSSAFDYNLMSIGYVLVALGFCILASGLKNKLYEMLVGLVMVLLLLASMITSALFENAGGIELLCMAIWEVIIAIDTTDGFKWES